MDERRRQDEQWGEQNYPDGTSEHYLVPSESMRKAADAAALSNTLTWKHILLEEVYEAIAKTDERKLKKELIQVAAVTAAWVEAINRRQ